MSDRNVFVTSPVDFGPEGISAIEVSLFYGSQHCDVVLNAENPRGGAGFLTDEKAGSDIRYTYRAYLRSGFLIEGPHTSFESAPRTTDGTVIMVDPRELYRHVALRARAVFSAEKYRLAFVDFKLEIEGDGFARTLTTELSQESPDFGAMVPVRIGAKVDLQHRIRYVLRQGTVIEGAWQPTEPGAVLVSEPDAVAV